MSPFKTPQEAIAACDAEFERAWKEFADTNGVRESDNALAYNTGKMLYRAGYMAGAKFISGIVVQGMIKHAENHVIQPDPKV